MEVPQVYDTITIMEKYNFHRPIQASILYVDNETEPIHVTQLEKHKYTYSETSNDIFSPNIIQKNISATKEHRVNNAKPKKKLSYCQKNVMRKNIVKGNPCNKNSSSKNTCNTENNNILKRRNLTSDSYATDEAVSLIQVAENLTSIMEAYLYYNNFFTKTSDRQHADQVKAKYMKIKYQYFYKTLSISKRLLLLHENNQQFIDDLYNKAKIITKISFPYEYFVNLYRDLLKWTKYKIHQMDNNPMINNQSIQAASLSNTSPTVSVNPEIINKEMPVTNIFSSGPPGSSITISVDQNVLDRYRNECVASDGATFITTRNGSDHNFVTSNVSNERGGQEFYCDPHYNSYSSYFNTASIPSQQDWQSSSDDRHNNSLPITNFHSTLLDNTDSYVQDTARNSISRDSGFTSPVMSGSPSEQSVHNLQSQYEQDCSTLQMLNFSVQPNIANELPQLWSY